MLKRGGAEPLVAIKPGRRCPKVLHTREYVCGARKRERRGLSMGLGTVQYSTVLTRTDTQTVHVQYATDIGVVVRSPLYPTCMPETAAYYHNQG